MKGVWPVNGPKLVSVALGFAILGVLLVGSTVPDASGEDAGQLIVFSGRREPLLAPVLQLFERQTGIQARVKFGETAELAQEILRLHELGRSVPDVFIGDDAGTLEFVQRQGNAFAPYTSPEIQRIPARFRAPDHAWMGVSGRGRVIIYNRGLVAREELPTTAFALIDPQWRGKIAATNATDTDGFVPWVSALRLVLGDALTRAYLEKLKANQIAIFAEQTDVRKAVGRGEFALGLINNYYVYLQRREPDPAVREVGILYHDQRPFQVGTLVNATGAAIVRRAVNLENAQRFMDFLASPQAQQRFAELNFEYPLLPGVRTQPDVLQDVQQATGCELDSPLECLKRLPISPADLGRELEETQRLLEAVSWF